MLTEIIDKILGRKQKEIQKITDEEVNYETIEKYLSELSQNTSITGEYHAGFTDIQITETTPKNILAFVEKNFKIKDYKLNEYYNQGRHRVFIIKGQEWHNLILEQGEIKAIIGNDVYRGKQFRNINLEYTINQKTNTQNETQST